MAGITGFARRELRQSGQYCRYLLIALSLPVFAVTSSHADTQVTLYKSFAVNISVTAMGGTLSTQSNTGNAYAVTIPSSTTYGVDVDVYDISSYLSTGQTNATELYLNSLIIFKSSRLM